MQLTPRQAKKLRTAQAFRQTPPTLRWFVQASLRTYLYLLVVAGSGAVFFYWAGWPIASGVLVGFFFATIARDLRWYALLVRDWPLSREITRWERVDELLGSSGSSAA